LFYQEELSSEFNRNIDFFNQISGLIIFPDRPTPQKQGKNMSNLPAPRHIQI